MWCLIKIVNGTVYQLQTMRTLTTAGESNEFLISLETSKEIINISESILWSYYLNFVVF